VCKIRKKTLHGSGMIPHLRQGELKGLFFFGKSNSYPYLCTPFLQEKMASFFMLIPERNLIVKPGWRRPPPQSKLNEF
jgi:hypothetical protein